MCNSFVAFFTVFSKINGFLKNVLLKKLPYCVTLLPSFKGFLSHFSVFPLWKLELCGTIKLLYPVKGGFCPVAVPDIIFKFDGAECALGYIGPLGDAHPRRGRFNTIHSFEGSNSL